MGDKSFKTIEEVCKRLGLILKKSKNGYIYEGFDIEGDYIRTSLHIHAKGRNIPDPTYYSIIKQLKFKNEKDFNDFLNNKKRRR